MSGGNDSIEIEAPDDEMVYNLNMMSVLSWRFSLKAIKIWALKKSQREDQSSSKPASDSEQDMDPVLDADLLSLITDMMICTFRFLPGFFIFLEVVILIGILDQAWKQKYITEFDGTFSLIQFKWSRQTECDASNIMKTWFQAQSSSDVQDCAIFSSQLTNFSARESFASDSFADLYSSTYSASFYDDLTYVFTHCFPWAYADVCANILASRPNMTIDDAGIGNCNTPGVFGECAYRNCYLPLEATSRFGGQQRINGDDWKNIRVPWDEINDLVSLSKGTDGSDGSWKQQRQKISLFSDAYDSSTTSVVYDENSPFVCNFMSQILNMRKDYTSQKPEISIYLFEQFHWIYYLGAGQAHLVELITLIFLSTYVYMTSMYSEMMQLLYQVRAHSHFSIVNGRKDLYMSVDFKNGISYFKVRGTALPHCLA